MIPASLPVKRVVLLSPGHITTTIAMAVVIVWIAVVAVIVEVHASLEISMKRLSSEGSDFKVPDERGVRQSPERARHYAHIGIIIVDITLRLP